MRPWGLSAWLAFNTVKLRLDFRSFGQEQRVLYVNTQIPDSALDFGVAEQDLHGTQVSNLLIDDRRFGPPQGMGTIILPPETYACDPLIHQPRILPGADVVGMIQPAWEHEVVERTTTTLQPSQDAVAGWLQQLELDGAAGFLLDDDSPNS